MQLGFLDDHSDFEENYFDCPSKPINHEDFEHIAFALIRRTILDAAHPRLHDVEPQEQLDARAYLTQGVILSDYHYTDYIKYGPKGQEYVFTIKNEMTLESAIPLDLALEALDVHPETFYDNIRAWEVTGWSKDFPFYQRFYDMRLG